jgi:ABC-type phosphate transport system auxiliary subunit
MHASSSDLCMRASTATSDDNKCTLRCTSICALQLHSVRDFEEGPMKAVQSLMRKRLKLRERRAQLEAQLDHAKSRDFNGPLDKV